MPYREMLYKKADLFPKSASMYGLQEDDSLTIGAFIKSQSPLMFGWFALMGLNLLFLLVTFQ